MCQIVSQSGRAEAVPLEGFTLRTLAEFLTDLALGATQLATIAAMIAAGSGCDVVAAEREGTQRDADTRSCLIDGPRRSIALGTGRTPATFVEGREARLSFFKRPGYAGIGTLNVEAWDADAASTWRATLTRDEHYRYTIDGRLVQVLSSTWEQVQCKVFQQEAGMSIHVTLPATVFWLFVFGATADPQALSRAQISAAHAAALLGLSMLTVRRRIGEGKFPALRPRSKYPMIELAGLVEYLAYRRQFPQGHPNLLRVEAWQREWRQAYRAELDSWRALDTASGSCVSMH